MRYITKHILLVFSIFLSTFAVSGQTKEIADSAATDKNREINVLYGNQKYDSFVGNVSSVKGDELKSYPTMKVMEALQGKIPGLFILRNDGNIGEENFTTFIRGNSSSFANNYLILVDGIERQLLPYDIDQIDQVLVLKDPVSKALYGGRICNGIILVTTKHGKQTKPQLNASFQMGVKMPTVLPEYLNSYDFARNYNQALKNDNNVTIASGMGYSDEALLYYKDQSKPYQYPDVDYHGEFLKKSMKLIRANVEYVGGSNNTNYYVHMGSQSEGGYERYGDNSRRRQTFNLQGNVESKFSEDISLHANIAGFLATGRYPGSLETEPLLTLSSRYPNAYPIFVAPDKAGGTNTYKDNPFAAQAQSGYTTSENICVQTDLGFNINIGNLVSGLSFKPTVSFDMVHAQNTNKMNTVGIYAISDFNADGTPKTISTIQEPKLATAQTLGRDTVLQQFSFSGVLTERQEFGKHAIVADLVYYITSRQRDQTQYLYKRQNLGLRVNYSYADKYSLEAVANYVGSSSYLRTDRFKLFPAVGMNWVVSKENFMEKLPAINYLKLSASWGVMGDGNVAPNLWRESWSMSSNYMFNTTSSVPVTTSTRVGSNNMLWPKQREVDVRVEGKVMKNFGFEVSYFDYYSYDWLSQNANSISGIYGGTSFLSYTNTGARSLKGFEFSLSYNNTLGKIKYDIGAHCTYGKSLNVKVDEIPDPNYTSVGLSYGDIRGYEAIGKYTQEDINKVNAVQMAKPSFVDPKDLKVGNLIYKDVDGNGSIDKYDQKVVAQSTPKMMYGTDLKLAYKGFELYAMLLGYGGYNRYLSNSFYQVNSTRKYSTIVTDGLPNGNAFPMLTTSNGTNDFQVSDYWVVNGAFLKIQNMMLSYTLPKRIIKAINCGEIKVYGYGTDLACFSKIKKSDPESLDAGLYNYPLFRTYALGISISF